MRMRLIVGLALLILVVSSFGESTECLSYEPAVDTLHGTLVRKSLPGPPNYQDVRKGDRVETDWFLDLGSPVCVVQDKAEPDLNPSQKNIQRVQLALDVEAYRRYRALLGERIVVIGTLFGAHTGHHYTPILLTVKSIAATK